jgi:hypothetical protein
MFSSSTFSLTLAYTSHTTQSVLIIKTNHGELWWMLVGIHVMCLLFLSNFNQNQNILANVSKNHVDYTVPCWQTDADMTKLIVTFHEWFVNVPKKEHTLRCFLLRTTTENNPQYIAHCVDSISSECGRSNVGETGRKFCIFCQIQVNKCLLFFHLRTGTDQVPKTLLFFLITDTEQKPNLVIISMSVCKSAIREVFCDTVRLVRYSSGYHTCWHDTQRVPALIWS